MYVQNRPIVQRPWFIPACALFGLICCIATAASQAPVSGVAGNSTASFTLSGEIPAHSALRAIAQYAPSGPAHSCHYPPALLQHDTAPGAQAQTFSFAIALSYSLPGCDMLLNDISLLIDAIHGQQRSTTSAGVIAVRADMVPRQKNGVPGFPASGQKEYRGVCRWQATAEQTEGRRLDCQAADKDWKVASEGQLQRRPGGAVSRQQLAGKTIQMILRIAEPAA